MGMFLHTTMGMGWECEYGHGIQLKISAYMLVMI